MPEKPSNTPNQPAPQGDAVAQRGALTGSGALQLIQAVTENPTVAGVAAGVVTAKATLMMSKPKDPPPPPPQPPTDKSAA